MKKILYIFSVLLLAFIIMKPVFANEENLSKDLIINDSIEEENVLVIDDSMTNSSRKL
jgi:putative cell wall-binding protein